MTIRSKLLFGTVLEILLVILASSVLIFYSNQIKQASNKQIKANKIMESVSQSRFVAFEYLFNHSERSYEQWQAKHHKLKPLIISTSGHSPQEQILLSDISNKSHEIGRIFNRLASDYNDSAITEKELHDRLLTQLLTRQQAQISNAIKLSDIAREETQALRQKVSWIAVAIILLMLAVAVINFMYVYRTITQSLNILQQGTRAIASGNLNYHIKTQHHDEFGRLASAFNSMATKLKQADQIKSDFILLASHQLRTPATAVKGYLALLMDGYMGKLSPKQYDTLESTYAENERQIRIINEILMVAQTETGEMSLLKSPTDLNQLVESVVAEQALMVKKRRQKVTVKIQNDLPKLLIDSSKIRIVIENIFNNAIKYSPDKSRIAIDAQKQLNYIKLTIQDNGPGISKKDTSKLFKKFSRISKPGVSQKEGSGLGLYLAKKIIELHEGSISIESIVGQGTTFRIQLPIERHK